LAAASLRLHHIPGPTNIVADALSRHIEQNTLAWRGQVFPDEAFPYSIAHLQTEVGATPPKGPKKWITSLQILETHVKEL
jgi:hypothetical protein